MSKAEKTQLIPLVPSYSDKQESTTIFVSKDERYLSQAEQAELSSVLKNKTPLTDNEITHVCQGLTKDDLNSLKQLLNSSTELHVIDERKTNKGQIYFQTRSRGDSLKTFGKPRYLFDAEKRVRFQVVLSFEPLRFVGLKRERYQELGLAEAQTHGEVETAGIIPVYDVFFLDGAQFISMAYRDPKNSPTLDMILGHQDTFFTQERLHGEPVFRPERIVKFVENIAPAFKKMAKLKFSHRDIKPSNLFFSDEQGDAVFDFNLSKKVDDTNKQTFDSSTDLYKLGLVVYDMMTSVSFWFQGTEPHEILLKIKSNGFLQEYCQAYGLSFKAMINFFSIVITIPDKRLKTIDEFLFLLKKAVTFVPVVEDSNSE